MKLLLTTPSLGRHGGIRNIVEWANRLDADLLVQFGPLHCDWIKVNRVLRSADLQAYDVLICCSPHAVDLLDQPWPKKKFVWMQMVEHLFSDSKDFYEKCQRFYLTPHPLIHGSRWGGEYLAQIGRKGPTHYVGTGVNLEDFPIVKCAKDYNTILLESPEPSNPAKDVDRLALKVAARLKPYGYRIIAYGALPLTQYKEVVDEYYLKPSLAKMNELYERATILLKATKFDARAVAPLEAMTKGCVTIRAIEQGDDDIINGFTGVKVPYCEKQLYESALFYIQRPELLERYASNNYRYIQHFSWDYYIEKIKQICGL